MRHWYVFDMSVFGVDQAAATLANLDNDVAATYVQSYMPMLYPRQCEGGYTTDEDYEAKLKAICPDDDQAVENPPLVDALLMYLIQQEKLDLDTLEGNIR